ncbi:hypothetical protein WDU94_000008, partial [Cyamophila willieti]
IKELSDEIYRVAIKKREDVIFELHKEICTKYEDILKDNYKTITDLQEQTKSMEDKIKSDKHRIDDLVEDGEDQVTELENKIKDLNDTVSKLHKTNNTLCKQNKISTESIKQLEEERDEYKLTVETLQRTIDEIKLYSPTNKQDDYYRINYGFGFDGSISIANITDVDNSLHKYTMRRSLAPEPSFSLAQEIENVNKAKTPETTGSIKTTTSKENKEEIIAKENEQVNTDKMPEENKQLNTNENNTATGELTNTANNKSTETDIEEISTKTKKQATIEIMQLSATRNSTR